MVGRSLTGEGAAGNVQKQSILWRKLWTMGNRGLCGGDCADGVWKSYVWWIMREAGMFHVEHLWNGDVCE
jgi:hypothetical protein